MYHSSMKLLNASSTHVTFVLYINLHMEYNFSNSWNLFVSINRVVLCALRGVAPDAVKPENPNILILSAFNHLTPMTIRAFHEREF